MIWLARALVCICLHSFWQMFVYAPVPPAGHQGSTTRSSSPTLKAFVLNQTYQCFLIRGFAGKPFPKQNQKTHSHIVEDVQVYHLQWLYLQLVLLVLLGKTPFEAEMLGTKDLDSALRHEWARHASYAKALRKQGPSYRPLHNPNPPYFPSCQRNLGIHPTTHGISFP